MGGVSNCCTLGVDGISDFDMLEMRLSVSASNIDTDAPMSMLSRSGMAGDHSQLSSTLF